MVVVVVLVLVVVVNRVLSWKETFVSVMTSGTETHLQKKLVVSALKVVYTHFK
jgi:hypothetical protein